MANPVKFRCFRCNQLLGISRAKIGAQIACPKCGVSLVVPDPAAPAFTPLPRTSSAPARSPFTSSTADSLLDIRPEDIRVEPGFLATRLVPPAPDEEDVELADEPEPEPAPEPVHPELSAAAALPTRPPAPETIAYEPQPQPQPQPQPEPEPEAPAVPGIDLEAPRRDRGRPHVLARPGDVVLPRSVVVAWSLFVLLGLLFSFLAGLFAGHYIWRVH